MARVHLHHTLSLVCTPFLTSLALAQPAGFPDRIGVFNEMRAAATAYPSICQFVDLTARYGTPTTRQGRRMYAVKISDNVAAEEDEPSFMIVAAHHGNEYGTPIVGLDTIRRLTTGYGNDPTITALVNDHEIWIAPLWNTDGYYTSRLNGGAVDLNRNYPHLWGSACNTGTKGPAPASEPETKTMVAWSEDQRFAKVLDFHSSGRETLYTYRAGCEVHPLDNYLRAEAIAISQASGYGGRTRGPSSNGEHYQWQLGNFSNYAFLTEISNTQSPTRASADAEAAQVWPGTVFMMQRPIPVWGHVTDAVTAAPLEAFITYVQVPSTNGERNRSEPLHGRYHAFLPVGNYTLRFSRVGYVTRDVQVNVTAAGQMVDVALSPPGLTFAFPGGLPAQVKPGGGTTVRVTVQAGTRSPQSGSGMLHLSSANETRSFPMKEISPNVYDATFPGFVCGDSVKFSFTADDTTGQAWASPSTGSHAAATVVTLTSVVAHDFEIASGWVGGQPGDTATTGVWNRMDPQPTAAQTGDDHTPPPGTICWATDGRAGASIGTYDVDGGFTTLMSPMFDLSGTPEAIVSYWRWFSNNQNSNRDDVFRVDITDNGGQTWQNVETIGPLGLEASGGWFQHSFRVADIVNTTAQVRMRFIATDAIPGSIVEAAIDDFTISVQTCDGEVVRSGTGCPDATGVTLQITHSGSVHLGTRLELSTDSGSTVPFVILVGTVANPIVLIPGTGTPGCRLYVQPILSLGPVGHGNTLPITIPIDSSLIGQSLAWQTAIADMGLTQPIRVATSDLLLTTIGS